MSISNQTEVCYLSLNSVNDMLICRGDYCLSKVGGGDVGDISSCGTTVLEKILSPPSNNDPSLLTLPIIIFITFIIIAIVIMIIYYCCCRSKNRNTADNYFTARSLRDQSFCPIETTEKHVENAIGQTIRVCYPDANYPAYEKQLFIVESSVRGNHVLFSTRLK